MLNVIKMDFVRMCKSKMTWVLLLSTICTVLFLSYVIGMEQKEFQKQYEQSTTEEKAAIQAEYGDSLFVTEEKKVEYAVLLEDTISGGIMLIFVTIFAVLFANGEQKSGYIKNIAGQVSNRGNLVLSKLLCLTVFVVTLMSLIFLFVAIGGIVNFGGMHVTWNAQLVQYLLTQTLLHLAFGAGVLGLTVLTKNATASIVIGIVGAGGMFSLVYSFINKIVRNLSGNAEFFVSNYLPTGNIRELAPATLQSGEIVRSLVVVATFILVGTVLGMSVMKKRDIG